jgi:hypothetical protein
MTEFVGTGGLPPDMRLRVERILHGKSWWFDLLVPEMYWGEFYEKQPGKPPLGARDAYLRSQPFWDWLAERNADNLAQHASPDAAVRRAEWEVGDFGWLPEQFKSFQNVTGS